MPGTQYTIVTPQVGVAISGSNPVTALHWTTPNTGYPSKMLGLTFNLHGVSTTDPSVLWQVAKVSGGSGAAGIAVTSNANQRLNSASPTANYGPYSTEWTLSDILYQSACHPQLGATIFFPYGAELFLAANTDYTLSFQLSGGSSNTVYATILVEY